MAAAVDTGNAFLEKNGSVSTSFTTAGSMTVASSDNFLAVFISGFSNTSSFTISSVSWNGNSLKFKSRVQNAGLASTIEIWYLANPPAGTGTFSVTASAAFNGTCFVIGFPMSGVNTIAPLGTVISASNTANPAFPISLTATAAGSNDVYIGFVDGNVTTATASGSNQNDVVSNSGSEASYILGSNSGAFSWTGTGGSNTNAQALGVAVFGLGGTAMVDTANFFLEENASTASSFTTAGSMTVSAADNYLAVFIEGFAAGAGLTFSSVSWNGNSLTRVGRVQNSSIATCLDLWTLTNPPAGTGTFTVTANEALGGFTFVVGIPMRSINLTTPLGTIVTYQATANPAFPVTLTATGAGGNDVYIGFASGNVTTATPTGNQVDLGAAGGAEASFIWGRNSGAFDWTSTGGGNANALGMGVAVFGLPPPFGGGVCVTA